MDKKTAKKAKKLKERIEAIETDIRTSLGKKTSSTAEINVPNRLRELATLKAELEGLQ